MKQTAVVSFNLYGKGTQCLDDGIPQRGRLPRVTEVLALALYIQELVERKDVANYAEFARSRHVSRERLSQVLKLIWLAPDIQVEILYLPPALPGRQPISELSVRRIAEIMDWNQQREQWKQLKREKRMD